MKRNINSHSAFGSLPETGNYTLIVLLASSTRIRTPSFGWLWVKKGYYAYTGSAFGKGAASLRQRVRRHFVRQKTTHWHIDYLLANTKAKVTAVVAASASTNMECEITKGIHAINGVTTPIRKFGASDCRQDCESHLTYAGSINVCDKVLDIYSRLTGNAKLLRVTSVQNGDK